MPRISRLSAGRPEGRSCDGRLTSSTRAIRIGRGGAAAAGPPPGDRDRPPRRDEPEYRRLPDEEGATDLDDAARDAVERLVAERLQCKVSRDFRRADEIRDELREKYLVYVSDKDRTWRRTTGRGGPPRRERRVEAYARLPDEEGATDFPDDAARNATEALISERAAARASRDYKRADELRDLL